MNLTTSSESFGNLTETVMSENLSLKSIGMIDLSCRENQDRANELPVEKSLNPTKFQNDCLFMDSLNKSQIPP